MNKNKLLKMLKKISNFKKYNEIMKSYTYKKEKKTFTAEISATTQPMASKKLKLNHHQKFTGMELPVQQQDSWTETVKSFNKTYHRGNFRKSWLMRPAWLPNQSSSGSQPTPLSTWSSKQIKTFFNSFYFFMRQSFPTWPHFLWENSLSHNTLKRFEFVKLGETLSFAL